MCTQKITEKWKNYFINNIPPERTIYDCNDLREFQKIVKVSGKYKYAVHGDQILSERVLRVFASRSRNDLGLFKVHKSKTSLDKVANTPEKCFIENDDIYFKDLDGNVFKKVSLKNKKW